MEWVFLGVICLLLLGLTGVVFAMLWEMITDIRKDRQH